MMKESPEVVAKGTTDCSDEFGDDNICRQRYDFSVLCSCIFQVYTVSKVVVLPSIVTFSGAFIVLTSQSICASLCRPVAMPRSTNIIWFSSTFRAQSTHRSSQCHLRNVGGRQREVDGLLRRRRRFVSLRLRQLDVVDGRRRESDVLVVGRTMVRSTGAISTG